MITTTRQLLGEHPFTADLSGEQLDRLSGCASRMVFRAGQRLFEEGGPADRGWLIRAGTVRLDTHVPGRGDVSVETLHAGTVLGWSWLCPPYRWHFGAEAVDTVLAVELNAARVRALSEAEPALGYELTRRFLAVVTDRLQHTRMRLLDLYAAAER